VWEVGERELRAAVARCPHRPQRPVLHLRGLLDGDRLLCTVHGNAYSQETGECVAGPGPDYPGCIEVVSGWRVGDLALLMLPEPEVVPKGADVGVGKPC
jgi:nitrite reductase/ring-hydroxylating ferredoxin subunit